MGFDDKETWDGEWLNSIGFGGETINGWAINLPHSGNGDPVTLHIDHDYCATLTQVGEGHWCYVALNSRAYFTRGDVRLLCTALGIKLQGGG